MRELVVILPDYFSVAIDGQGGAAPAPAVDGTSARLPALELLLSRSHRSTLPPDGWRAWLRKRWGLPHDSPASTVAAAWGEREPAHRYWLATPVHLFAGLDSVHLHPQGLLRLGASEQLQLVEDFGRVFHDSPWRLMSRAQRDLLLSGPVLSASGADPATLLGADPSAGLPQGVHAAALRRLASEIELWLHEHPVNVERQRRAELPVTALWLWGADEEGAAPAHPPRSTRAGALPLLTGEDNYLAALWQLQGAAADAPTSVALPAATSEGGAVAAARGRLVLQRTCEPPGLVAILAALEQRWLAPGAAALRSRELTSIDIVTAERAHSLRWRDLGRVWRRQRAWWELL